MGQIIFPSSPVNLFGLLHFVRNDVDFVGNEGAELAFWSFQCLQFFSVSFCVSIDRTFDITFIRCCFRVLQKFRAFRVSEEIEPQMFTDKSRWRRLYFHHYHHFQWILPLIPKPSFRRKLPTTCSWNKKGRLNLPHFKIIIFYFIGSITLFQQSPPVIFQPVPRICF